MLSPAPRIHPEKVQSEPPAPAPMPVRGEPQRALWTDGRATRAVLEWARATLGADGLALYSGEPTGDARPAIAAGGLRFPVARDSRADLAAITEWYRARVGGRRAASVAQGPPPRGRSFRVGRGTSRARWAAAVPVGDGLRQTGFLMALWREGRRIGRADLIPLRIVGRLLGPALQRPRGPARHGLPDQARQVRSFIRIARLSLTNLTPQRVASRLLAEFCRALGFTRGEIWFYGADRKRLWRSNIFGPKRILNPRPAERAAEPCRFARLVLARREGLHHTDVRRDVLRPEERLVLKGVTSVFGAPLMTRGCVYGMLYADHGGSLFDMSAGELERGTALSALGGEVLSGALGREREARRQRTMRLLCRANQAISSGDNLPSVLRQVLRISRQTLRCRGVILSLVGGRGQELEVTAASGPGAERRIGRRCRIRSARGVPGADIQAFMSGKAAHVQSARILPRSKTWWPGIRSVTAVPIHSRGKTIGVLCFEAQRTGAFDDEDREAFMLLGEQIGHAVRRSRLLENLRRRQRQLREVSANLEKKLEEDRRRIAGELHDELAQSMTAAKINLALLRQLSAARGPEERRAIRETEAIVERLIVETRRISMDLRPAMLDDLGLLPALKWLADTFSSRAGIEVTIEPGKVNLPSQEGLKTLLYRFVQEALTNVARHARARSARIGIEDTGGVVRAFVQDDGIGMRAKGVDRRHGLGLVGMRERVERAGGVLRIRSGPRSGTCLEVEIPMVKAAREARRSGAAAAPQAWTSLERKGLSGEDVIRGGARR